MPRAARVRRKEAERWHVHFERPDTRCWNLRGHDGAPRAVTGADVGEGVSVTAPCVLVRAATPAMWGQNASGNGQSLVEVVCTRRALPQCLQTCSVFLCSGSGNDETLVEVVREDARI